MKKWCLAQGLHLADGQLKNFLSLFCPSLHLGLKNPLFTTKQAENLITITSNYPNYMQDIHNEKEKRERKVGLPPNKCFFNVISLAHHPVILV